MANFSEMGIQVVEGEETEEGEAPAAKAEKTEEAEEEEPTGNVDEASLGRTDDPVRMYLREMGSVELLSREGEIAIAKRIEAGRDMMIGGLCESPLTFKAIISWHDQLKAGRMLLRDIIDLEATAGRRRADARRQCRRPTGDAPTARRTAPMRIDGSDDIDGDDEGEGPGISLSALEEKLKPEVLATFEEIEALYKKLHKMQHRRLETMTSGEEVTARSEKTYERQREELVEQGRAGAAAQQPHRGAGDPAQAAQPAADRAGRPAAAHWPKAARCTREEFLKNYRGHELDPNWLERVGKLPGKGWKTFVAKHADRHRQRARADRRGGERRRPADRRVPPRLHDGEPRRARQRAGEEGDDRGEPAPGDLDRQEIHQPRPAVPGPDPGRQHRPDEGGR